MSNNLYKDLMDLTEILKTIKFPIVIGNAVGVVDLSKADCIEIAKRICMEGFRRQAGTEEELRSLLENQEKTLYLLLRTHEKIKRVCSLNRSLQSTAKKEENDCAER